MRTLSSASSIKRASLLKRVTYDLRLSSSCCLMFSRLSKDLSYLCPLINWVMKGPLNSLKVDTVLGVNLLNYTRASSLSVVGNALHIISSRTPYRCMRVLNNSRWSRGFFDPSYASTCGILNLAGRGKDVIGVVKGESVRWTSLSKLVDTQPFRPLIIISIFSIIICISCDMRNALNFSLEGRLVSY